MLVKDIMTEPVVTIREDQSILEAREIMRGKRLISLPVVNQENKLCGIVSRSDIFRSIVEIMGMNRNCLRITIEAPDKVGVVAEISNIMKEDGINIISLVTKQNGDGTAEVTIRAALNNNGMDIIEQIREAGYEVSDVMTLDGIE